MNAPAHCHWNSKCSALCEAIQEPFGILEWQINAGECSDEVNMYIMHTHIYIDDCRDFHILNS